MDLKQKACLTLPLLLEHQKQLLAVKQLIIDHLNDERMSLIDFLDSYIDIFGTNPAAVGDCAQALEQAAHEEWLDVERARRQLRGEMPVVGTDYLESLSTGGWITHVLKSKTQRGRRKERRRAKFVSKA